MKTISCFLIGCFVFTISAQAQKHRLHDDTTFKKLVSNITTAIGDYKIGSGVYLIVFHVDKHKKAQIVSSASSNAVIKQLVDSVVAQTFKENRTSLKRGSYALPFSHAAYLEDRDDTLLWNNNTFYSMATFDTRTLNVPPNTILLQPFFNITTSPIRKTTP